MSWIFAKNACLVTWWSTGVASGRGRGWLVSVVVGTDETTNATGSVLEYEGLLIADCIELWGTNSYYKIKNRFFSNDFLIDPQFLHLWIYYVFFFKWIFSVFSSYDILMFVIWFWHASYQFLSLMCFMWHVSPFPFLASTSINFLHTFADILKVPQKVAWF